MSGDFAKTQRFARGRWRNDDFVERLWKTT
jgi:hypothetical protein